MNKEIEQLNFENIYAFCDYAIKIHDKICDYDDSNNNITFVAKYVEAREIINYMIAEGYDLRFADFSEPEDQVHGYQDEFYVMISRDELFVEPAKVDGKYLDCEDGVVFIIEGVSSAILEHIKGDLVYDVAFNVNEDTERDGDCENYALGNHDELTALNENREKHVYTVNGKEVSKSEYDDAKREVLNRFGAFDEVFTDMIQKSLLMQCSARDLYNDLLADYCGIRNIF